MAYRNQNYMTNCLIKELVDKNQKNYIEQKIYTFKSYNDENKTTLYGEGTVQTTGKKTNGYAEVEVLTNTPEESFVGQKFYITADAEVGSIYQLYSDAGETGIDIYVEITEEVAEENNSTNNTSSEENNSTNNTSSEENNSTNNTSSEENNSTNNTSSENNDDNKNNDEPTEVSTA